MPFQSTMSRIALAAVVLLSLGFLARAAPVAAPAAGKELVSLETRGTHCYGGSCYGGLDLVALLLQLQAAIELKLKLLDGCLYGGDYAAIILDIEGLLLTVVAAIKAYDISLLVLLKGKLLVIAKIWAAIVISIATHFGKWYGHAEWDAFLGSIVKIDVALQLSLSALIGLGGVLGGLIGVLVGLFTKVHIALFLKLKLFACLGVLGLGGYY